jgi:hypothetical protein
MGAYSRRTLIESKTGFKMLPESSYAESRGGGGTLVSTALARLTGDRGYVRPMMQLRGGLS